MILNSKLPFFAEVVESFLTNYKAQCWTSDTKPSAGKPVTVPAYGTLVVVEQENFILYAIVHQIVTQADDPVFSVRAYQKTEEELRRDQPHVFEFLHTFFGAIIIAYRTKNSEQGELSDNKLSFGAAPVPARLHAFVRMATDQEWSVFAQTTNYLSVLFGQAAHVNIDEVLLAFINGLKQHARVSEDQLIELLHAYTLWCGNDYRRMRFFAQRLEQL